MCGRVEQDPAARFCDVDGAALASIARQERRGPLPQRGGLDGVTVAVGTVGLLLLGIAGWLLAEVGQGGSLGSPRIDLELPAATPRPAPTDLKGVLSRCYGPTLPPVPRGGAGRAEDAFQRTKEAMRLGMAMSGSLRPVTPEEEARFGDQTEAAVMDHHPRSRARRPIDRLQRTAARLIGVAPGREQTPYRFTLLEGEDVNAMMAPGGRGLVFVGLLDAISGEDALAFVLGHELAHGELRHASDQLSLILAAEELGAAALGDEGGELGRAGSSVAGKVLASAYDQDQEYEADRLGLCLAWLAGSRSDGGAEAMVALGEAAGGGPTAAPRPGAGRIAYDVLTSHPPREEREAYLRSLGEVLDREGAR